MKAGPQAHTCSRCGTELAAGLGGLCPACVGALALGPPSVQDQTTPLLENLPEDLAGHQLLSEIARGGMGVVFKARHRKLNRTVAVKLLRAGQWAGPLDLARFRAEAEAAAHLQHPNIVTLYEVGEQDGMPYFSMEYVEGHTLAQAVEHGPLPPRQAAGYLKIIAEAIQYAHQQGVLHRDLKPSNVLLDRFDQPRLTDFGLAKRLDSTPESQTGSQLTFTGQVLGTPSFMSPEQAAARNEAVGPATDVYSLGAILYFLLTARPPISGTSLTEALSNVLNSAPVPPRRLNPAVPRDLETICLKCLEKDAARRYGSAAELAFELDRLLNHQPILARPVGPLERSWRWCRRNPAGAGLAATLAITLSFLALTVILAKTGKPSGAVFSPMVAFFQAAAPAPHAPMNLHAIADDDASAIEAEPPPPVLAVDGATFSQAEIGVGSGLAVDPQNNKCWAATLAQGGIIVRSGKNDQEGVTFTIGSRPATVALDATHRLAWITGRRSANSDTNDPPSARLWAVDADSYRIVAGPIDYGEASDEPALVNPATGRYYHNGYRADPHAFVPTTTSFCKVLAVYSAANLLYAVGSDGLLQILDGAPDPELVLTNVALPFPAREACVAVDPLRNRVLVGGLLSKQILVLEPHRGEVLDRVELNAGLNVTGVRGLAIDAGRNRLYAIATSAEQRCYLLVIQGASQKARELPGLSDGPVLNPAVNKIYVWGRLHGK